MKYLIIYLIIVLLFATCTAQKERPPLYTLSSFKIDDPFPGNTKHLQVLHVNDTTVLLHWSIDGGKTIRQKIVFLNKDFYTSTEK